MLAEAPTPGDAAEPVEAGADGRSSESKRAGAGRPGAGRPGGAEGHTISDGTVSVRVRRDGPLRTTLHAVRNRASIRPAWAR